MASRFRMPWSSDTLEIEASTSSSDSARSHHVPGDEKHPSITTNHAKVPSVVQAKEELPGIAKSHHWDQNLPRHEVDALRAAVSGDLEKLTEVKATFGGDDSPYEEVRAAVRTTDGGEVANTVRAWVLGMFFVTICSGLNMFLSMRSPAINFPAIVVILLVYPFGCCWAKVMPVRVYETFGVKWTLNTGPFTIKEHVVVGLMANVSIGYAYATDALLALAAKPLYNIQMGWGFQLLFTISSQLIGIALAGMFRRFLVWPSAMIWPGQFSNTALFYALHDKSKTKSRETNGWSISQYRFYIYLTLGAFVWYWFPGVIWQGLSVFAFATWIKPNSVVINQLFGGFTGLSLIPITFDWTYVSGYLGDPLLAPVHALVNTGIGLVVFVIVTTLGIAYTNSLYADYLPINTSSTFDNTQSSYNVSRMVMSRVICILDRASPKS